MKKLLIVLSFLPVTAFAQQQHRPTDDQIKQNIIQQSIASYPGVCACPYSTASNGSQCGGRSAYSKPGGHDPICYPADVTPQMIQNYKRQNGIVENTPVPKPEPYISPLEKAQKEIAKAREYNRIFALQLESIKNDGSTLTEYTRIQNAMAQNNQYIKHQEDIIKKLTTQPVQLSTTVRPYGAPADWENVPGTSVYIEGTARVHTFNGYNTKAEVWGWDTGQGYIKITVGCSYDSYSIVKDDKEIVNNPYNPGHQFWYIKKQFCYNSKNG